MQSLSTVLSVFLLLFLGYGAKKLRWLKEEDAGTLNALVIRFTMPAFIFNAIYTYHEPLPWTMAKIPLVGFGAIAVVLVLGYLCGRVLKIDRPTLGGMIIACGFGNTGFLGYPVTQAAFPGNQTALITAALYDELVMAFFLYTLGMSIAAYFAGGKVKLSQLTTMLKTPMLWAIPVALAMRAVHLPAFFMSTLDYLARGTVPLVMISLGLVLSARSMKGLSSPILVVCVLKLLVLPVLTYYGSGVAAMSGTIRQVTVLESGMPSAVMTCIVAGFFGANERFVAGAIFVTTLLSIATIPIILHLLGV